MQLHICQNKTAWTDNFCYTGVLVENPAVPQGHLYFVEITKWFVFNQLLVLMTETYLLLAMSELAI